MSQLAKILSLSYDSAVATKTSALKNYYRSVRLIKNEGYVNPLNPSYINQILLCGNCIDPEKRNLYVFYIDTFYLSAWIIEINIDSRVQTVVYYDKYNAINFNQYHKIYNARVVHGRLVWTDDLNPIYQMDIERAKRSFHLKIGYGQYPVVAEWSAIRPYGIDEIVSNGNYFYRSVIDNNTGIEPRLDSGANWQKLCLIEDAYYSMNVKNFYFEPIPPKHPPVVTYESDDTRKINNLRQTLFQCAYRYVYMDWRKSTLSPASIVPLPQAEEETATGLANETISLNNKLQIVVNSGGEEVRAIEIIGRSSQDPSKWFLIETIDKFSTQERGDEVSKTAEPGYITLGMTVVNPLGVGTGNPEPKQESIGISILAPTVDMSWVLSSVTVMGWTAVQYGNDPDVIKTTVITSSDWEAAIGAIPDWIDVLYFGMPLVQGMNVDSGSTLTIYPKTENTLDTQRLGTVTFTNLMGDSATITFHQAAPLQHLPITPTIQISPADGSGMTLGNHNGQGLTWSTNVNLFFVINHPSYTVGQTLNIYWRAEVNGIANGSDVMYACTDITPNVRSIILANQLVPGDVLVIYLSSIPF